MRHWIIAILVVLGLSACSMRPYQGPEMTLKPQVTTWQFNQPLSRGAWQSITTELSASLALLRVNPVVIEGAKSFSERAHAIQAWLIQQGTPKDHIKLVMNQNLGVRVSMVQYQVEAQSCDGPKVLYQFGENQHRDLCAVTLLRWQSMVYPQHMLKAGSH
ncbi:hypothetical protein [Celerinatantimonas sp. MCCC 1A17872]|uniref:hypothetical protein n=1 Tax=Celerinatantimonas sp. MCCC 1A17872 TaxID=3177514 RepID=UPI0038C1A5C7